MADDVSRIVDLENWTYEFMMSRFNAKYEKEASALYGENYFWKMWEGSYNEDNLDSINAKLMYDSLFAWEEHWKRPMHTQIKHEDTIFKKKSFVYDLDFEKKNDKASNE
jgi:hypothetical protein